MSDDLIKVSEGSLRAQLNLAGVDDDAKLTDIVARLTVVPKFKLLGVLDATETIVSMASFNGRVLVATSRRIFEVFDDKLVELQLAVPA